MDPKRFAICHRVGRLKKRLNVGLLSEIGNQVAGAGSQAVSRSTSTGSSVVSLRMKSCDIVVTYSDSRVDGRADGRRGGWRNLLFSPVSGASFAARQGSPTQRPLRPISVLKFWMSEGLTQAESSFKGWNSHVHREFPRKFESRNLSRDNLSR